jgi:hypothetical protein
MSLPNIERAGWQPGAHWVALSPEQQHELDIRYKSERIADEAHELWTHFNEEGPEVPQEKYDREESIQRSIALIQNEESYANRTLTEITRDGLSWINEARKETEGHYHLRYALEREAHALLLGVASDESVKEGIDGKLLGLLVQWASIKFFTHRYYRDWDVDDHTPESALELIKQAGISLEDFTKLCQEPIDAEAKRLHEEEEYDLVGANQLVIEARLLDRATELGVEVGKVHGFSNYLNSWGI